MEYFQISGLVVAPSRLTIIHKSLFESLHIVYKTPTEGHPENIPGSLPAPNVPRVPYTGLPLGVPFIHVHIFVAIEYFHNTPSNSLNNHKLLFESTHLQSVSFTVPGEFVKADTPCVISPGRISKCSSSRVIC